MNIRPQDLLSHELTLWFRPTIFLWPTKSHKVFGKCSLITSWLYIICDIHVRWACPFSFQYTHFHRSSFASSDASAWCPTPFSCARRQRLNVSSRSHSEKPRDLPKGVFAKSEFLVHFFCPCDWYYTATTLLIVTRHLCFHVPVPQRHFVNQVSKWLSCSATLPMCGLTAFAIVFTISTCRMHWPTFCNKACVGNPDGRGHSWPSSAVGKVYREFVVDHVTCHAFLYACSQIFSAVDLPTHFTSILWGLRRTGRCRFLPVRRVRQKVMKSAGGFWLDCVPFFFLNRLPLWWRSCHSFPCPSNSGTGTRHWFLEFWDVCHLSSDLLPVCIPFASDLCQ